MARQSRLSADQRRKAQEHQIQVELIRAFAADPTLKYWVALTASSGAVVGLDFIRKQAVEAGLIAPPPDAPPSETAKRGILDFVGVMFGGAQGAMLIDAAQQFKNEANNNPFGTIVGMTSTFAGVNAACLLLSSMSGGNGGLASKLMPVL